MTIKEIFQIIKAFGFNLHLSKDTNDFSHYKRVIQGVI